MHVSGNHAQAYLNPSGIHATVGGSLRTCTNCFFAQYNLGLDSLQHLCRCACVQDHYDIEQFEQQRFESEHFCKSRMAIRPDGPHLAHNY